MKYTYAYKTPDGVRHEDSMDASSREEVFTALRTQGIRPIKVVAADGSKANGEVRGVRKRVVFAIVAVATILTGIAVYFIVANGRGDRAAAEKLLASGTRRQVIGDTAVIEKGIRTGWADIFDKEGDRFLASFAIPGVKAGQRNTSEEEMKRVLDETVPPKDGDPIEAQQIKAMVEGMKAEARSYIAAGGTIVGYGRRLVERQEAEIAIYNRVKTEAEKTRATMSEEAFETYLEERNDELRNLGIKPVVFGE